VSFAILNNIFLFLAVGSENQIYLSFDMPLREHGDQRGHFFLLRLFDMLGSAHVEPMIMKVL
jgi:hypothetical protein